MDLNWMFAVLPIAMLFTAAIMMHALSKSWLWPGALFPLVVSGYFAVPLIIVPYYYSSISALWWVFISMLMFVSGSFIVGIKYKFGEEIRESPTTEKVQFGGNFLVRIRVVTLSSILLGLLASIAFIIYFGKSLNILFRISGLVQIGSEASIERYTGFYSPPLYIQILLVFAYLSPILGGIIFNDRQKRSDTYISVASLLPSILIFMVQTTRAAIIFAIALWVAGYLSAHAYNRFNKRFRIVTKRNLFILAVVLLTLLVVFLAGEVVRKGTAPSLESISETLNLPRSRSSLFGHVTAFSIWFQQEWESDEAISYGAFTFGGIFETLGLSESTQGIYIEKVPTESNAATNIYTIHRGFIEDFGFPGTLLFLFVIGCFSSIIFYKVAIGRYMLIPLLAATYTFLFYPIVSVFNYRSIIIAFFVLQAYFLLSRHRQGSVKSGR